MLQYLLDLVARLGDWSYLIIFAVSALECAAFLGLVVPGESLLLACGFLSHRGPLMVDAVIAAGIVGAVVGDNIGYEMGRRMGREWLLGSGAHFGLTERRLRGAERFFDRHGSKAVFVGRFVGYARALVPFIAGSTKMNRRVFLAYNALGAVLWVIGVTLAGYFLGASWRLAEVWLGRASAVAVVVVFVVAGVLWLRRRRDHELSDDALGDR